MSKSLIRQDDDKDKKDEPENLAGTITTNSTGSVTN
jgi:hypothetical protein